MGVTINEIKDKYTILLHKVNESVIGELPFEVLNDNSNSMNEVGSINLTINKYYRGQIGKQLIEYFYYDEIKNERMISLDGYFYVIKDIKEDDRNNIKTITAYSKEKKLEKITISVEDLGFYLQSADEESGIYSLDEYMYDETGWKFGYIDESVKNNDDGTPKMRWQESVDTSWLDYLTKNISTQFTCYVHFDTKQQLVNLYDMATFGENFNLCLSYDNYIRSLEKSTSSSDIVTKLILVGNEDECIVSEATVTGENYIENFSYFIENEEISKELINALDVYYKIVEVRQVQWKSLRDEKIELNAELTDKKTIEKALIEDMNMLEINIKFYEGKIGTDDDITGTFTELLNQAIEEFNAKKELEKVTYERIRELELLIEDITNSMTELNILCKKKTATNSNGNLIFNTDLLDELKKITSSETFADDSFYDAEEIIASGTNKLNILCRPTKTWEISVEDFTSRLINNGFRQQWKGVLGLGDVICLLNPNTNEETFIYLVGYTKGYKDKSLSLTLSNKKESEDVVRYINDFLKLAKANNKIVIKNRRLWSAQKNNRINISRDEVM